MRTQNDRTRRQILRAGMVLAGGITAATAARAQEKIDRKSVQYQPMPKDGNRCGLCINFVAPKSCKIVAGTIAPNGWCLAFQPKQA
jgi:hypothetical protein